MSKDEELNWMVRGHLTNEATAGRRFSYGQRKVGGRLETRAATVSISLDNDGQLLMYLAKLGVARARLVLMGTLVVVGQQVVLQESHGLGFQADTRVRARLQGVLDDGDGGGPTGPPGYPGGLVRP